MIYNDETKKKITQLLKEEADVKDSEAELCAEGSEEAIECRRRAIYFLRAAAIIEQTISGK